MTTVTMEILGSIVKHHFLIVIVPILNQIIKKKQYVVVKNYVDYSVVFILTKLIAVYLYTASMLFFWGVGRWQVNALQIAKNALKQLFSQTSWGRCWQPSTSTSSNVSSHDACNGNTTDAQQDSRQIFWLGRDGVQQNLVASWRGNKGRLRPWSVSWNLIKNRERERRGSSGQLAVNITSPQQLCPLVAIKRVCWTFLSMSGHANQAYAQKIGNRVLYVTHGDRCTKGNAFEGRMTATDVLDLHSTQEEADRRMFLHAFHASADGHHSIATFSSDTDVEVLASHHQAAVPVEIILIRGTMSRSHLVSIRRLCEKLGHRVCQVSSSLHALTGCGTVRSFVGRGKKKALDCHIARETVQILGETIPPGEHDINKLEKVICKLYNEHQFDRVD